MTATYTKNTHTHLKIDIDIDISAGILVYQLYYSLFRYFSMLSNMA